MRLNQVIAVEKGVKSRAMSEVDAIAKMAKKPSVFEGRTKVYVKASDQDDDLAGEHQRVQLSAKEALEGIASIWKGLFDVTAQKDYANCLARANVVVDGKALVTEAPVTYLLFLEKQLTDLHTIVSDIPTLDRAKSWKENPSNGLHYTDAETTTRTKKVQKGLVLYPHSPEHPAQTQLITEDVAAGKWSVTYQSGALTEKRKRELMDRIQVLRDAVKQAREEANMQEVGQHSIGDRIFDHLLA